MSEYIITHEPEREDNVGSVGVVLGIEQAESPSSALSKWAGRVVSDGFSNFLRDNEDEGFLVASIKTDVALGILKLADDEKFDRGRVIVRELATDENGNTWETRPWEVFDWDSP